MDEDFLRSAIRRYISFLKGKPFNTNNVCKFIEENPFILKNHDTPSILNLLNKISIESEKDY